MVRGRRRRRRVGKRRRGQKGGDPLRRAIGNYGLPLMANLYGKLAGSMMRKVIRAKRARGRR